MFCKTSSAIKQILFIYPQYGNINIKLKSCSERVDDGGNMVSDQFQPKNHITRHSFSDFNIIHILFNKYAGLTIDSKRKIY